MNLFQAINSAMKIAMETNPKTVHFGEDVLFGGVFRCSMGLSDEFGRDRVFNTPLSEQGIAGFGIGMAAVGYDVIAEMQFADYIFPAFDQIVVQLARMRYRSAGALQLPITIRMPFGGGIGSVEHHGESPEAYFASTPGLRVVACADPTDAYWMIQQAIASDDPVIFLEPKRRYYQKGEIDTTADLSTALPFHRAKVLVEGSDCTIICYGPTVATALQAARLAVEDGVKLEVIDLRSLSPLDLDTLKTSVMKTGRAIVVHEASSSGGIGGEVGQCLMQSCFYNLKAPVLRVTGYDTPYPPSRIEDDYLPDADRILDAVEKSMSY